MISIPAATRSNPFKERTLARAFDELIAAYNRKSPALFVGADRYLGNSISSAFWRGYDAVPPVLFQRGTFGWAAYRAGRTARLLDNKQSA